MTFYMHVSTPAVLPAQTPTLLTQDTRLRGIAALLPPEPCSMLDDARWIMAETSAAEQAPRLALYHARLQAALCARGDARGGRAPRPARKAPTTHPPKSTALGPVAADMRQLQASATEAAATASSLHARVRGVLRDLDAAVARVAEAAGAVAADPCRACGSNNTLTVDRQMRSADEGATMLCKCRDCGHTWRYNT